MSSRRSAFGRFVTSRHPARLGDACFIFLDQIRSASIVAQRAGLVLFDLDADQIARKVVVLGQPVKRLATQKLLDDLTLELNAMGSMSRHRLLSKSQALGQSTLVYLSGSRGPLHGLYKY